MRGLVTPERDGSFQECGHWMGCVQVLAVVLACGAQAGDRHSLLVHLYACRQWRLLHGGFIRYRRKGGHGPATWTPVCQLLSSLPMAVHAQLSGLQAQLGKWA